MRMCPWYSRPTRRAVFQVNTEFNTVVDRCIDGILGTQETKIKAGFSEAFQRWLEGKARVVVCSMPLVAPSCAVFNAPRLTPAPSQHAWSFARAILALTHTLAFAHACIHTHLQSMYTRGSASRIYARALRSSLH